MIQDVVMLLLSKILPVFVYPLGLALSLQVGGALAARLYFKRLSQLCFGAAIAILWVCATPVVANRAVASLERQYPARTMAETPEADVAIVLGGFLGQPLPPRVASDLSDGADRALHATRLYRAGKVRRILVSAGNLPWERSAKPEAELIKELLVEWGVPPGAIELGTESRDTYENALEVQQMWRTKGYTSALLVTSAAHMPRAMATFRRAGLPVVASTTDVTAVDDNPADLLAWLPNVGSLGMTTVAVREWLGFVAYKARGRL
jgi:uncharacterized SAM-binding protein YcdF (DUF218 family)